MREASTHHKATRRGHNNVSGVVSGRAEDGSALGSERAGTTNSELHSDWRSALHRLDVTRKALELCSDLSREVTRVHDNKRALVRFVSLAMCKINERRTVVSP